MRRAGLSRTWRHRARAWGCWRALGPAAAALALFVSAGSAHAEPKTPSEDTKRLARDAYVRGEAALARDEYAAAAAEFTYADELLPNDAPLQAALDAALRTTDVRIVVTLLNRVDRPTRSVGTAVTASAKRVRDKFDPLIARFVVECPRGATCSAELDKAPLAPGTVLWVVPGTHWLRTSVNGGTATDDGIDVKPGGLASIPLSASTSRRPLVTEVPEEVGGPPPGPSPAYFWVGVGLTAVLVGVSTASTIDYYWKNRDVNEAGCPDSQNNACGRLGDERDGAKTRSFVLWGVSGAVAVATAVTGLFVVRWKSGRAAVGSAPAAGAPSFAAGASGVSVSLEQRF